MEPDSFVREFERLSGRAGIGMISSLSSPNRKSAFLKTTVVIKDIKGKPVRMNDEQLRRWRTAEVDKEVWGSWKQSKRVRRHESCLQKTAILTKTPSQPENHPSLTFDFPNGSWLWTLTILNRALVQPKTLALSFLYSWPKNMNAGISSTGRFSSIWRENSSKQHKPTRCLYVCVCVCICWSPWGLFTLIFFNLQDLFPSVWQWGGTLLKINLYPCFVALPPPWQCMSAISRPVWIRAFQRMRPFANVCLLFSPYNAAHSPCVSLPLLAVPHLTPTRGVTQSIQMCFTWEPHYLAPVVLFNTIKGRGPSMRTQRASLLPSPLARFCVGSGVTGQESPLNLPGFVCIWA